MFTSLSKREKLVTSIVLKTYFLLQYQSETKRKKRVFSQYTKKKKGKKSTGFIFISADLGMLSSGILLNLLQQTAGEDLLSK